MKIRIDGSACYMDDEPDENGVHHGEWKHSEVPVSAVWNDEDCEWEEWHPPDPEPRRRRERDEPMSDIKYEPTREHWTPYEPWMRDVLADDARVSWVGYVSGSESRSPWLNCKPVSLDWLPDRDARIHPDDVPERPAEAHPDEALAQAIADAFYEGDSYDAAREHIEQEPDDEMIRHEELVALLAEIRDRLPEPEGMNAVEDEPVDVTEEPPGLTALLRRALGDDTVNATVTDAPVDPSAR